MEKTYISMIIKNGENTDKMRNAIREMGLMPQVGMKMFPNGRGYGYKITVNGITPEQKEAISNLRNEIEPLF